MAKAKIVSNFERNEKKFLLTKQQYKVLNERLNGKLKKDEYGKYTISSLYYDTDSFDIIRHSLDKPVFKEKLRLRSYGVPQAEDDVFLEIKKKFNGATFKRRVTLPLNIAENYLNKKIKPKEQGQIFGEIDWFVSKYDLEAKVMISYDRLAFLGVEDDSLRITFDTDIRFRDYNLSLSKGDYGSRILPAGMYVMEIKTLNTLPLWLSNLLSELSIFPRSFSKYGNIYKDFLLQKEEKYNAG